MTKDKHNELDALLHAAAAEQTEVPEYLMTRVMNDATAQQDRLAVDRSHESSGVLSRLSELFGGWIGLSGVAAASCVGFWIGVSPPEGMPDAASMILGGTEYSVLEDTGDLTGFGWDLEEG